MCVFQKSMFRSQGHMAWKVYSHLGFGHGSIQSVSGTALRAA